MASVKQTTARINLDFALGIMRVPLGELSEKEFDDLLRTVLDEVDLRELRGFKPLKELFVLNPGSYGGRRFHTLDVETLSLSNKVSFEVVGFGKDSPMDLETHVLSVCRGNVSRETIYKRIESGEETSDLNTAISWGQTAYNYRGSGQILALRRPRNHSCARENLIIVSGDYEKVELVDRHVVTKIRADRLPLEDFRRRFGAEYPLIATGLIWELRDAHSRTADQLQSQAQAFRKKVDFFERLSDTVSSS